MDAINPYDLRPWVGQCGSHIRAEQPAPQHASLPAMAKAACGRFAARTAFTAVMPNGMFGAPTYREVEERSDQFARYLPAMLGLAAGDRVAIELSNVLAYPVVLLGVLKAGCVAVNTNPLYTAREMAHQFKDSGAKGVIVDLFADKLKEALPQTDIAHVVITRAPEFFPVVVGRSCTR